ncbi:MAG TPA: hypothetical protein VGB75_08685 [Jatrophihabitans sp.]|jgi:hypothetical protein|uniref:hypothetical protein n=1 Tax=Jatrophihabitans sp. TaxID=1932789 RepID=UPI002EF60D7B
MSRPAVKLGGGGLPVGDSGPPAWRRYPVAALGVRLVTLLAGLAVLVIAPGSHPWWVLLTVAGVLVAVASPDRAGAGLALGAGIGNWFAAYGWHATPPLAATAGFALALYLLHTSTALAAAVPLSARLRGPVLRRWTGRCAVELAVAAALAGASYGLGRPGSTSALQLLGLLGVLVLVGIPVLLAHRSRG